MFQTPKPYISFKYIEAKTPKDLELLMLSISIKSQFPISFTPPSFVGSKWTSWYLYDFSQDIKPKDKLDMINQDKK